MTEKPRLILADDHAVLRSGLRMLLESQGEFDVVGEAVDGEGAVQLAAKLCPALVLMDISMPGVDGMEATRRIKEQNPAIRVLVLTMHDDPGYMKEVLAAGASGYILKKAVDSELISAIKAVLQGGMYVYPSMTRALVSGYLGQGPAPAKGVTELLSPREREVLRMVALGHTSREIGDDLGLSAKTIEGYRSRLADKLGSSNRSDLIRTAIEAGLLDNA